MNRYQRTFGICTLFVSVPCVAFMIVGLGSGNAGLALGTGGMASIWCVLYLFLRAKRKGAFALSLIGVNIMWWPTLLLTISWVRFVLENDSLEGPDGVGSPVAFLLIVAVEQYLFIPTTLVIVRGIIEVVRGRRSGVSSAAHVDAEAGGQ